MKKQFRDFESAREFVRNLGLKSRKEWENYYKSGKKPDDIPAIPTRTYKKDFKGVGDWLGTGYVSTNQRVYRSFQESRNFVRNLGLKSRKEWSEYCKSGKKPDDIPASPEKVYKKDFKGVGDWLGTGRISLKDIVYLSFKEAREFVQKLNLKNVEDWKEYCKFGEKPNNIPQKPERIYKKDFKGMGDWLGTGRIANQNKQWRPFKDARKFVRALKIKNQHEWYEYCKSGKKPNDIPADPWIAYKEWKKK